MLELIALVLLLGPEAGSAETVWPGEGDTVYISASFNGLEGVQPVAGAKMKYNMPPCRPLTVTKAVAKKQRWVDKDPVGGAETLEGGWLPWMHKSEAECQEEHSRSGEPEIKKSGATFRMVAEDPGGEAQREAKP